MVRHSEERNTRFFESSGGAGRGHCGGGVPFGFSHAETGVERPDRPDRRDGGLGHDKLSGRPAGRHGGEKEKISAGSGLRLPVCSGSSLHLPGRREGDGPAAGPAGPLPGCLRRRRHGGRDVRGDTLNEKKGFSFLI